MPLNGLALLMWASMGGQQASTHVAPAQNGCLGMAGQHLVLHYNPQVLHVAKRTWRVVPARHASQTIWNEESIHDL